MDFGQTRVLVVEDDPLMRAFTVHTLRRLGISHIQECADGASGLNAVRTFCPDVILSDIHMSPMSGLEFVQRLRNGLAPPTTKVLFLSTDRRQETLAATIPLGVEAYIVKPPRLEDLKMRLEAVLRP